MKRRPATAAPRRRFDDDGGGDIADRRRRRAPLGGGNGGGLGLDPRRAEKRMRMAEAALERGSSDVSDEEEEDADDQQMPPPPRRQQWQQQEEEEEEEEEDDGSGSSSSGASEEEEEEEEEEEVVDGQSDDDDGVQEDDDAFLHAPLESRLATSGGEDLSHLPLDQRERLLRDGAGPRGLAARRRAHQAAEAQRSLKRESRDRPREMSSKRPVSRYREVIQVSREAIEGRDPRFPTAADALGGGKGKGKAGGGGAGGGDADEAAARKRFAFLYDEAMPRERAELKARLKREKSAARADELRLRLVQVEQRLRDEAARRRRQQARDELRGKEKQAVAEGKRPYFAKRSEVRAAELVARYEELKKGGKLEQYMEKRRRRNAAKDHRFIPSERRGGG
jgi:ribosomal RNA-processing protein 36